ncbi:hypothetical protein SPRG_09431 [Saprolegnia parasitica CBS 223.65]|uniref:DNA-directed RNA polymerase III subunit RPC3 n=1 Tax=Saprolegnia parasitica (strain CBS 223.65) TaxID=695850 RepID=A0A067C4N1_SAPPC|nr:hypothetical protein SPRG_09431 [Saprolegnia parasitica CBS 223.65]KDO25488.1 hypothetical protein SPRG_09431 [Saprolegnia parasitica CBS 223.65]|eukprot:XP_012203913.1 hypothetical protein SPRG_09431 [Saprolegnia parasitica CBS 223.65]
MVVVSQSKRRLLLHVLLEHFGEHVEHLARVLLKADDDGFTLREILLHTTKATPSQLKAGLLKMLQHNMLDIKSHWANVNHAHKKTAQTKQPYTLRYTLNHDEVLRRLRFARYIELANSVFGEEGAIIMEELLVCGRLRLDQSIEAMAFNLAQARRAADGNSEGDVDADELDDLKATLRSTFLEMAKNRYIVRVHPLDLNNKQADDPFADEAEVAFEKLAAAASSPSSSAKATPKPKAKKSSADTVELDDGFSVRRGTKRKAKAPPKDVVPIEVQLMMQAEEAEASTPPAATSAPVSSGGRRRRKEAKLPSTPTSLLDNGQGDDLTRELRHRACIKFAKESVNDVAEVIVQAMLHASSPHERGEAEPTSFPMTARDLFKVPSVDAVIPQTSRDRWKLLLNYLTAMCQHPSGMLTKTAPEAFTANKTGDGGTYAVHMQKIVSTLERKTVHAFVQDTYGTASARILRVVYEQRQAEEKTIGELALLPASETRSRLFGLFQAKLIQMQEIPKRADYNPQYTLYCWSVDHKALIRRLVERIEVSLVHLRTRRQREADEHKDLIARSDQLVEQHDLDRFDRVCRSLDRFDRLVLQLDRMLLLCATFRYNSFRS